MRTDTIVIPDVTGRCRWCQCTTRAPCAAGCSWVNPQRSLCSSCEDIDAQARTPSGRRFLARLLHRTRRAAAGRTKAGRGVLAQTSESGT